MIGIVNVENQILRDRLVQHATIARDILVLIDHSRGGVSYKSHSRCDKGKTKRFAEENIKPRKSQMSLTDYRTTRKFYPR